jgi:hypothetical protein
MPCGPGIDADFFFSFFVWDWVHLIRLPLFGLLYQLRMGDDGCGAVGGMSDRGNWSTRRKLAPVLLCPLQILYNMTRVRNLAVALGSRRLTAWATAMTRCRITPRKMQVTEGALTSFGVNPFSPITNWIIINVLPIERVSLALTPQRYLKKTKLNSMVWVRERTVPTERPPLVGEVIVNFRG